MRKSLHKLKTLICLDGPQQRLLALAAVLLLLTRGVLLFLPYRLIRGHLLNRMQSRGGRPLVKECAGRRVLWAVELASRSLRLKHCLTKAIVAKMLLHRSGYQVDFLVGVKLSSSRTIQAHAWLESDGRVVLGALPDLDQYTPFPGFGKTQAGSRP